MKSHSARNFIWQEISFGMIFHSARNFIRHGTQKPKFDNRKKSQWKRYVRNRNQIWRKARELIKIVGKQESNVLHSVLMQLQSENLDENLVDRVQYRLDWLYSTVVRYADLGIVDERVVNCISLAKECLQQNSGSNSNTFQLAVEAVFTGERGRP